MALETGTNVGDLVSTNPTATDPKSNGDDHIRLLKSVLQNSFAGYSAEISLRGTEAQGSTVNDFTVTVSPAPSAYHIGSLVTFKSTHANTAGATLQINSLGTKTLLDSNGVALPSGAIPSGAVCQAVYDGTNFYLVSANGRLTSITPTVGDSSTKIATTAFVAATSFSTALPGQSGNSGKFLSTDGSAASWSDVAPAFPSGTTLAGFIQSTAPTGWTKITTYNDYALRIVSGTVTTGGTVNFTTAFNSANIVDGTAITTAQMPSHSHTVADAGHNHTFIDPGHAHGVADPGHAHSVYDPSHAHGFSIGRYYAPLYGGEEGFAYGNYGISSSTPVTTTSYTSAAATGIGIYGAGTGIGIYGATTGGYNATGYTGISVAANGSGSTHTHNLSNLAVKYVDAIVCVKN